MTSEEIIAFLARTWLGGFIVVITTASVMYGLVRHKSIWGWIKRKLKLQGEPESSPRKEKDYAERLETHCPLCDKFTAYRHWPMNVSPAYSKVNNAYFDACWKCYDYMMREK
jgi:hypothetical protein